jgi:hypothetical protein
MASIFELTWVQEVDDLFASITSRANLIGEAEQNPIKVDLIEYQLFLQLVDLVSIYKKLYNQVDDANPIPKSRAECMLNLLPLLDLEVLNRGSADSIADMVDLLQQNGMIDAVMLTTYIPKELFCTFIQDDDEIVDKIFYTADKIPRLCVILREWYDRLKSIKYTEASEDYAEDDVRDDTESIEDTEEDASSGSGEPGEEGYEDDRDSS